MIINEDEIRHIAKLANLNLNEKEIKDYAKDLTDILGMANLINNVNTDNVDETIGSNGLYNVFRKDVIKQNSTRENLLSNAPSQDDGMFRIPKVIN